MKIRTITTGMNIRLPNLKDQFKHVAETTLRIKKRFEKNGYIVQTARIATQPWEEYYKSKKQIIKIARALETLIIKYGLDYFNIGTTRVKQQIPLVYDILKNTDKAFCTVSICDNNTINFKAAAEAAVVIKRLSTIDPEGFTNLRFAALFNMQAGSPFFPAAYHKGSTSFAIGTENSDLVYKSFSQAKDIKQASSILKKTLTREYRKIESIARKISIAEKIEYNGIDVSIATSVNPEESIAYAIEKLGLGRFGEVGTLAVAKIITDTLKRIDVKKCGYCGLMLPVLEDYGLATSNNEGTFNLTNLLLYSAVCGTGLDTIPLPGNISENKLYALILDIASLAIKLNKPLSARLMPVPNKKTGDMTNYGFAYFVNSKIMKI